MNAAFCGKSIVMSALRALSILTLALASPLACSTERAEVSVAVPSFAATRAAPGQPPTLDTVTHLLVISRVDPRSRGFPSTITDSTTIRSLVAFVEGRALSWRSRAERALQPTDGPLVQVDVFHGPELLATLTYGGALELRIQGKNTDLFQVLAPPDANAFAKLVGAPIKVIAVPARNAS